MLYRKKYLIGIYGPLYDGEPLVGLCDNAKEFAEFMKISVTNATQILYYLFNKKTQYIRVNNKLCTVAFIEEEN